MGAVSLNFDKIEKQVAKQLVREEQTAIAHGKPIAKPSPEEWVTLVQAKALSVQRQLAHGDKRFEQYRDHASISKSYLDYHSQHTQQLHDASRVGQRQQQLANTNRAINHVPTPTPEPTLPELLINDQERTL